MSEDVEASFTAPAIPGDYDLCVRGTDAAGNLGDPECITLNVPGTCDARHNARPSS